MKTELDGTPATQVKICGVTRVEDAVAAAADGASYVGSVLVASSPRVVSTEVARRLADAIPIPLVVVVADLPASEVAQVAERSGARVIQFHGSEPPERLEELRELGGWELWKAVRVRSGRDIVRAVERFGGVADLLLLDGWHPVQLGGAGQVFPWEALESVRNEVRAERLRLGVAGGLTPENVTEAVARMSPDLVDTSSGVEMRPGIKDPRKIRAFVHSALGEAQDHDRTMMDADGSG